MKPSPRSAVPVAALAACAIALACATSPERHRSLPDAGDAAAAQSAVASPADSDAFERGEILYGQADYASAAVAFEEHLAAQPGDPRNDEALLRLALIDFALRGDEGDVERGERSLRALAERHPGSALADLADYILALRQELANVRRESDRRLQEAERLEAQIGALKRIDLEGGDPPP